MNLGSAPSIYDGFRLPAEPFRRMQAVRNRAASETGFTGWNQTPDTLELLRGEVEEFAEAVTQGESKARQQDELGDVLFYAASLADLQKLNPHAAMRGASDKFVTRFRTMETLHQEQARQLQPTFPTMSEMSRPQWNALWAQAKQRLAGMSPQG